MQHPKSLYSAVTAAKMAGSGRKMMAPETIAFILRHGEAKVLITDTEFSPVIRDALARLEVRPAVIDIVDVLGPGGDRLGEMDYETFLITGKSYFEAVTPQDEWEAIAL